MDNMINELMIQKGKREEIVLLAKDSKHIITFAEEKSMYAFELAIRYTKNMRQYSKEIADKYESIVRDYMDSINYVGGPSYKNGIYFDYLIGTTIDYYGKLFKCILGA